MNLQFAHWSILLMEDTKVGEINPDDVTPGVVGFAFTAIFAVAVILIGLDMYRRIRRMQYRAEVQAEIEEELAARTGSESDAVSSSRGVSDGPRKPGQPETSMAVETQGSTDEQVGPRSPRIDDAAAGEDTDQPRNS